MITMEKEEKQSCTLCGNDSAVFFVQGKTHGQLREYWKCERCDCIFVPEQFHLSEKHEVERYEEHNNEDATEYRQYLQRMVEPVIDLFRTTEGSDIWQIIDYGAGPVPVLQRMMKEEGYQVEITDKYFSDEETPNSRYDLVISTEVVEHFRKPNTDWDNLLLLVKPGGYVAVMTQLWQPRLGQTKEDFLRWHYRGDPTHIIFYAEPTIEYIAEVFDLSIVFFNKKNGTVIFQKA